MRYLLCLLFCLLAGVVQAAPANKAYMSIIIDDLGQSTERDSRTLALPGPVTMAIMPDTPMPAISPARPIRPARR